MKFQYLLMFILVLIFFPIPLKLSLIYSDSNLIFYIYKFQIVNTGKKKKEKKPKKSKKKKVDSHGIKKKEKRKTKKSKFDFVRLLKSIMRRDSKFIRMLSSLEFSFQYGLEDAYYCAMLYGVISSISGLLPNLINKFLNLKKYDFKVKPLFNQKRIDFRLCFKLYFNLIYIIYAGIFVFINSRKKIT